MFFFFFFLIALTSHVLHIVPSIALQVPSLLMLTPSFFFTLTHPPFSLPPSLPSPCQAIKRLQDVAVGVVAPYTELITKPIAGSVAVVELADISKSGLPVLPVGTYTVPSQLCLPERLFFAIQTVLIANRIIPHAVPQTPLLMYFRQSIHLTSSCSS